MDQDAFRDTYHSVNDRACVLERAVLTNQCDCAEVERFCIAEREGVTCRSAEGHARCTEFVAVLRDQARFALKSATAAEDAGSTLPFGKAMRVQVGGLRGLCAALDPQERDACANLKNVDALLRRAIATFGTLTALPFSQIMPHIAAYKARHRARRRS